MKVGSLFAGVGGFDLGFHAAGWDVAWQVEWDARCRSVLARHWPDVPRYGDVREVTGRDLAPVDCITYGFPCQDLSVAGNRAGLDGERSGLFFEATRIIREMRKATDGRCPTWAVAENVAGLLNADDGHAMGRVLNELADIGAVGIEWATLDAQHFGVPQRRRRVFVVAVFHSGILGAAPLLPVGARCARDSAPSGEARQDAPSDADARAATTGGGLAMSENQRGKINLTEQAASLLTGGGKPGQGYPVVAFSHTQGIDAQPSEDAWPTLRSEGGGHGVMSAATVRRLTPKECERLMGWPDDHTRWDADGNELPDSFRYRACGNGVVAPVAEWIAQRILEAVA